MATTPVLKKYVASLRGVGPGGIPVAAPDGIRLHGATLAVHYSLTLEQYVDQLHPALGPTSLWGYHPDTPVLWWSAAEQAPRRDHRRLEGLTRSAHRHQRAAAYPSAAGRRQCRFPRRCGKVWWQRT